LITLWRLTTKSTIKEAFDGEGAKLFGGRWNRKGTSVVYCAHALSLCVLETLVHTDSDLFPEFYSYSVEAESELMVGKLARQLPADWRNTPAPELLQDRGNDWVKLGESVLLQVPSVVVEMESNYLLNPAHPDFSRLKIKEHGRFTFDPRLLAGGGR
jgi:RES domain-containing protein